MPYERYKLGIRTVKFNGNDSYEYFGMVLQSAVIEVPQRKITKVTSSLTDGDIDISDYISSPKYKNRKLTFNFAVLENESEFDEIYRKICSEINGVYFEKGISYYGHLYTGRASVNKWRTSNTMRTVTIDVDAKPYSYDLDGIEKRYE